MTEYLDFRPNGTPYRVVPSQTALAELDASENVLAKLSDGTPEARNYRRLLEKALDQAAQSRSELVEAHRRIAFLEHQARTDEVTGLLNRRGFELALETALARVRRFGEKGVLVLIDLDGFKDINDTHGHQAGDLVLATVGTVLSRHTRDTDSAARVGGDEFALILTDADLAGAKKRVRVLDRIMNYTSVPWKGTSISAKASFGTVAYGPNDDSDAVFERADAAMYARKAERRSAGLAPAARLKAAPDG